MSTNNNERRPVSGLGFGFNAREIDDVKPAPAEEVKPAAAPSVPQFSGRPLADSDDKRARLLPGFTHVADQLGAQLAIDEAVRRSQVTGHLPITAVDPVNIDADKMRANLAASVKSGEITNAQANTLWSAAFGDRDPGSVSK